MPPGILQDKSILLLQYLLQRWRNGDSCFSVAEIASSQGWNRKTVIRHIGFLRTLKMIEIRGYGRRKPYRYVLTNAAFLYLYGPQRKKTNGPESLSENPALHQRSRPER